MNAILVKIFATILRRKLIQQPDGTKAVKWYQSETIIAGIIIGLEGVYFIARTVLAEQFQVHLPAIREDIRNGINALLGGTVVWGRFTAEAKIVK